MREQVWEGDGVVKAGRTLLGATKPSESAPGSIRGDYCIDVGRNVCHASDSVVAAEKEIALWFPVGASGTSTASGAVQVESWASHSDSQLYE